RTDAADLSAEGLSAYGARVAAIILFVRQSRHSYKEMAMNRNIGRWTSILLLTLCLSGAVSWAFSSSSRVGDKLDEGKIAQAAGSKATTTPDGVVRLGWARTDVAVTVDGMPFKPAAGLGSWAAFTPAPHGAMVMGDTVVFQDEVTPAMDAAFAGGLEVTGLHNHFFYDEPKVYFMHIGGRGEPEKLAAAVKSMWDAIKKVRKDSPQPA